MKQQPYDILVLEIQKEGKSLGSISIKYEDIDMLTYHGTKVPDILMDMYSQLENGIPEIKDANNEELSSNS